MLTFAFSSILTIHDQVKLFTTLEAGGLLAGRGDEVLYALPAGNAAAKPESEFAVEPEQMADFLAHIEEERLELLGTYHSHPNGNARMSGADAAMAQSTGLLLIVGPGQAWEWRLWDPLAGGETRFAIAPPNSLQP